MKLRPVALTPKAFKPYGFVIHNAAGKPMADNREITYWGKVSHLRMTAAATTGVLVNHKRPAVVTQMERHVKTHEILAALEGDSVFCVARPSKGGSKIAGVKAFRVKQGEALAMLPGTWHWVPFPVGARRSKFLVVFAAGTEANDLETKDLCEEVRILS